MLSSLANIPRIERRAALLSLIVGVTLLGVKFGAYFLTGSTVIFADAVESIVNVLAAGFALYSLALAHRPPDEEHPYGHGKIEFFSAGLEGGMILVAAVVSIFKAIEALVRSNQIESGELGVGILLMVTALAINGGLGFFLIRTGRSNSSLTLEADGWHLLTDAITSAVALVALGLVYFLKKSWVDPVAAILVSFYIARTGIHLLNKSAAGLMDRQDEEDTKKLVAILDRHANGDEPKICSYHKLRHRHSGRYHWVDFHLVVPRHLDVEQGHKIATAIENEMQAVLGEGNATAHVEPCVKGLCGRCEPKSQL